VRRSRIKPRRPQFDPEHKNATLLAAHSYCLLCSIKGKKTFGCVPAHFPHHRNRRVSGTVWDVKNWVPLCVPCHDWIDWRTGGVSAEACARREDDVRELLIKAEKDWWSQWK